MDVWFFEYDALRLSTLVSERVFPGFPNTILKRESYFSSMIGKKSKFDQSSGA